MTDSLPIGSGMPAEVASFIGRERELAEIERILTQTRLLTLTGAGGCGKTRLALRAAAEVVGRFPDSAWFTPLAPIGDSALVPRAVAATLGERGAAGQPILASLAVALAPRRLLLILDNCEHLIGACARLAETLLRACPHITILTTSREPLRIPGEVTWRVPSLATPDAGPLPTLESLTQIEAVALFVDRAQARRRDFTITPQNAPSVVAICRQLEGLPLGIELAAAQVGALALEHIAARLDDALRLLSGGNRTLPRHETLRATLDWSHDLLSDHERALFRRLAVFGGGFDVEAAERVCQGEEITQADALPLLMALAEKSLVEPQIQSNSARYRLLEPVRQYAWARLAEQGEVERLRRRHADYFLALAESAEPWLMSGQRGAWMERLAAERDNVRGALAWCRQSAAPGDITVGLRLTTALFWYWAFRGEMSEGLEWVETLLAKSQQAPPAVHAKAVYVTGELSWVLGQHTTARAKLTESAAAWRALGDTRGLAYTLQALALVTDQPDARNMAEESLRLFEEVGDAWGAAHALLSLGMLAMLDEDGPTAQARLEQTLACWRTLGDEWGMAQTLNFLGDIARSNDDIALATARYEESLALLRHQDLTGTVPSLLHNLGYLALRSNDERRAWWLFRESLALFQKQGDQRGIAECLAGLAGALGALRQPERAARLFGAADALFEAMSAAVWSANVADFARSLARAHAQLDEQTYAAAYAAGRMLTIGQALAEVEEMDVEPPEDALPARPPSDAHGLGLTQRELDVAALVAQGLTNRQIGAALVITEGTARLHVKHILHKLGFSSRAQIAAWAVAHRLVTIPS